MLSTESGIFMRLRTFLLMLAVSSGAFTSAPSTFAQGTHSDVDTAAEAKRQFLLGREAFDAKRYADAAQNFEAAGAYKPHPVTFYTAAVAWELAGRSDRAADAFSRSLEPSNQGALKDDEAKKARERLNALEGVLGTVTISAPDGWKVQFDGNTETLAPAHLHARPGVRTLIYRAPGKAVERKELSLEAGQRIALSLPEPTPVVVTPPQPVERERRPIEPHEDGLVEFRKSAGLVLAGVGAAGLLSSLIIWNQAQGAKDAYDVRPTQEALDHGQSMERWTNITLITGAVLLAAGVTLYVIPSGKSSAHLSANAASTLSVSEPPRLSVGATPRGAFLSGHF